MNNERIQLPDFLIADLYKGSLVDLDSFTLPVQTTQSMPVRDEADQQIPSEKIRFLGENKKDVAILVDEPAAVFLLEENLDFLTSILKACQLTLADIAIVNVCEQKIEYEAIKQELNPKKMLLFDVDPSMIKLPFLIPVFQPQNFDGCTIMVAPPLPSLNKPSQEGKLLKTKLWVSLKHVFNIA